MVNKVRKKDGSMKYPYTVVMPFAETMKFLDELQNLSVMKYAHRDNKSYGTYIWGSTYDDKNFDEVESLCKKYIPDFELGKTEGVYKSNYHGEYISFSLYVAYAEFDKEV